MPEEVDHVGLFNEALALFNDYIAQEGQDVNAAMPAAMRLLVGNLPSEIPPFALGCARRRRSVAGGGLKV